jgi:dTDP-4-dehydrorhamnose 3,5-epimerase-like enzyme
MTYVPHGFGHGFIALTDNVETLYLIGAFYAPEGSADCAGMIRR